MTRFQKISSFQGEKIEKKKATIQNPNLNQNPNLKLNLIITLRILLLLNLSRKTQGENWSKT